MRISDIQKYDSSRMYETYEKWPEIAHKSYFSKHLQKMVADSKIGKDVQVKVFREGKEKALIVTIGKLVS